MGGTRTRAPQSRPRSVAMTAQQDIPVSVFTGFLGAGKTTIILSLLKQLPKDYKVVLLKNEFGDVEVDSQLAKESAVEAVSEILNGCMCCVLLRLPPGRTDADSFTRDQGQVRSGQNHHRILWL